MLAVRSMRLVLCFAIIAVLSGCTGKPSLPIRNETAWDLQLEYIGPERALFLGWPERVDGFRVSIPAGQTVNAHDWNSAELYGNHFAETRLGISRVDPETLWVQQTVVFTPHALDRALVLRPDGESLVVLRERKEGCVLISSQRWEVFQPGIHAGGR